MSSPGTRKVVPFTFWPKYVSIVSRTGSGASPQPFMYFVGAIEIARRYRRARPSVVADAIVVGLAGNFTDLEIISAAAGHVTYWDTALGDLGLPIGAMALARLVAFVHQRAARPEARGQA